jgi:hypothetical protein
MEQGLLLATVRDIAGSHRQSMGKSAPGEQRSTKASFSETPCASVSYGLGDR